MSKSLTILLTTLILVSGIVACDRPPCTTNNPIFKYDVPESKGYQHQLAWQLHYIDRSKLTYWVNKYSENDSAKYLHVNVQGDTLCAIMVLTIKEVTKGIDDIIRTKGLGYHGAEIKGLKYSTIEQPNESEFIYQGLESIID